MATRTWGAGGGGDWGATASWSGATVPVTGDTVIFPPNVTQSVTAGLDQGGVDLALLYVHPEYTGAIGSTGSRLKIAATLVDYNGTGGFFYESDKNTASAFKTDVVRLSAAHRGVPIEIDSNSADAGDVTAVYCMRGNITLGSSIAAAITRVEVGWLENPDSDVSLVINDDSGSAAITDFVQHGGTVECNRIITTGKMAAGRLIQDTNKVTNFDVMGGTMLYRHTAVGGDATTIRVRGRGILDLIDGSGVEKTVSTVWLHDHARLIRDTQLHTITTLNNLRLNEATN